MEESGEGTLVGTQVDSAPLLLVQWCCEAVQGVARGWEGARCDSPIDGENYLLFCFWPKKNEVSKKKKKRRPHDMCPEMKKKEMRHRTKRCRIQVRKK